MNSEREVDEYCTLLKNIADFIVAVNGLPWKRFLWAGWFSPPKSAIFGSLSSVAGLYLIIKSQREARK
jgi:hypothetical protein